MKIKTEILTGYAVMAGEKGIRLKIVDVGKMAIIVINLRKQKEPLMGMKMT